MSSLIIIMKRKQNNAFNISFNDLAVWLLSLVPLKEYIFVVVVFLIYYMGCMDYVEIPVPNVVLSRYGQCRLSAVANAVTMGHGRPGNRKLWRSPVETSDPGDTAASSWCQRYTSLTRTRPYSTWSGWTSAWTR